jgi:hypothetical protein
MNARRLLKARTSAPIGLDFDVWFLPLVLETLEPQQAAILIWLLEHGGSARSDAITSHFKTTPQRAGSAISDLRRLGLLTSQDIPGESTRASQHTAARWAIEAWMFGREIAV